MTNAAIRPRRTCHTGFVLASGLAIDTRLTGETAARQRILALFSPGTEVFRVGPVVIAIFATPLRVETAAAPGTPLARLGPLHSASPLEPDEREALQASEDSVVLIDGGLASATPLDARVREDVSSWIDLSAFAVIGGLRPLGDVTAAPHAPFAAVSASDLRKSLGVSQIDGVTATLLRALQRGENGGRAQSQTPAAPRVSWAARIRDALANALWSSRLGGLLGRQYGKHLSRLLAMFDANDLDNALRHALPLNAAMELARQTPPLWSSVLWSLWRRKDFSIGPRNRTVGTSLTLDQRLFEMLRARYRQAVERLEATGQIEKAAFVLAELLNATEEAVSFLERHGRLRLAAEIAEMRQLPPGLVIRQWFLAGEHERAIEIAQRTGAFLDAITRLSGSHKDQGTALRLLWAHRLALGGAYAAAVDVAWPAKEGRRLAFAWIDRAIAAGGATGARMLARKAAFRPEAFPELRDQSLDLMHGDDEETRRLALAFGEELLAGELTEPARLLIAPTVRRLLRDGEAEDSKHVVRQLLNVSEDSAFTADVRSSTLKNWAEPKLTPPLLSARTKPLEIVRLAADRGAVAIHDAAETADGRLLVAIGEAGALLLSREGKVITRFGQPANAIVMSDNGDRALLLAQRGEVFRISRLDLISRRLRPWRDARFDQFAPDFDGLTWFVAREGALYAVDATAPDWRRLWKVAEDDASVLQIRRSASSLSVHFYSLMNLKLRSEVWTYELPGLVLRRRDGVLADGLSCVQRDKTGIGPSFDPLGIGADGAVGGWKRAEADQSGPAGETIRAHGKIKVPGKAWADLPITADYNRRSPYLSEKWVAAPDVRGDFARIQLLNMPGHHFHGNAPAVRATIMLEMAKSALVRIQGERMLVFDQCGRLLVLCLKTGAVIREHRIAG